MFFVWKTPMKKINWATCIGLKHKEVDKGAPKSLLGACCCKCSNLAKVNYCSCGHCGRSKKTEFKFACLAPQNIDGSGIYLQKTQHGLCEVFEEREDILSSEDTAAITKQMESM